MNKYPPFGEPSKQEKRVLQSLLDHYGDYKKVAKEFTISETTVKTHANNLFIKFGVNSKMELVVGALENGLLRLKQTTSVNADGSSKPVCIFI